MNDPIINDPAKYAPVPRRLMLQCNFGMVYNYKNRFARPDADLFCTTLDMARFGQMLLNGGTYQGRQLLSPVAVREMATVQTGNLFPGNEEGYGIGTFVQRNPSAWGPSPGSFGHRGARSTVFWVDPTDDLVLVFMTQVWTMTGDQAKAIDKAFFKTAIEKYGASGAKASAGNQ